MGKNSVTTSRSVHNQNKQQMKGTSSNSGNTTVKNTVNGHTLIRVGEDYSAIPIYKDRTDLARPYYSPNEIDGNLDISRYGAWCLNPPSAREGIVPIIFREYQPEFSNLVTNLARVITHVTQGTYHGKTPNASLAKKIFFGYVENPIKNTFLANATNFTYRFPYLSLQAQDFNTSFGDAEESNTNIFKTMGQEVSRMLQGRFITKGLRTGSGSGLRGSMRLAFMTNLGQAGKDFARAVYPAIHPADAQYKFYKGSSPVSWSYSIELSNTISPEQSKFNKEFVELIAHNGAMGNLRNQLVGDGPCIYSVEIPNVRWIPACKLDVTYEGKGNLLVVNGDTIPESYVVTIKVIEFFPPLRVITDTYLKYGKKLEAINSSPTNLCDILTTAVNNTANLIKGGSGSSSTNVGGTPSTGGGGSGGGTTPPDDDGE